MLSIYKVKFGGYTDSVVAASSIEDAIARARPFTFTEPQDLPAPTAVEEICVADNLDMDGGVVSLLDEPPEEAGDAGSD
jgi:hypothetical protein